METFLDTCIILTAFDVKDKYYEVVNIFLDGEGEVIISVFQEKEEIPKLFSRKQKFFIEAIKFFKDRSHLIDYSPFTDSEKAILRGLVQGIMAGIETEENLLKMQRELNILRKKSLDFVQNKVSRKVTPIKNINPSLVDVIVRNNGNLPDSKIIASAIQEHQENKLIAFTLDKKDWKIKPIKSKIETLSYSCPEVRFLR